MYNLTRQKGRRMLEIRISGDVFVAGALLTMLWLLTRPTAPLAAARPVSELRGEKEGLRVVVPQRAS